jgi:protein tyrosine phosphatase (PTP) superfamily phosphohydrolase (DUF442 family)
VPDAEGTRNFAEIHPGLARGGQPTEAGIRFLRDHGYRTVVSFRSNPSERDLVLRSGMAYVEIPMRAGIFGAAPPTEEQARLFLSVVTDSSRYPVFIHCRRGKDRTGAMSAIYRMEACGWTADEAIEEMRTLGFSRHYRRLLRFVRGYLRHAALEPGDLGPDQTCRLRVGAEPKGGTIFRDRLLSPGQSLQRDGGIQMKKR